MIRVVCQVAAVLVSGVLFFAGEFDTAAQSDTPTSAQPPQITGFTPGAAYPGTVIIINGSNLTQVLSIQFGDLIAPIYGSVDDGTMVQTQVPTGAVTGPVTVTTAAGGTRSSVAFEVLGASAPVISRFTPASGPPGTRVTLEGSGLVNVTDVSFNGVSSEFSTMVGLVAFVPAHAASGPISVRTKHGSFTTTTDFVVTAPPLPVIATFSPEEGYPGVLVTITGANLTHIQSVTFGGVASGSVGAMLGTTVWATVPAGAKTGPIAVVTDGGSASSADIFAVTANPKPVIHGFSPTTARPGDLVSVSGEHFVRPVAVHVSGVQAELHATGADSVIFVVPYTFSGPVTVSTAGGSAISEQVLTIIDGPPPPELTEFAPPRGLIGSTIAIHGRNFGRVQALSFNGTPAPFEQRSEELLIAAVPAQATTGPIELQIDGRDFASPMAFEVFNSGELEITTAALLSLTGLVSQITFETTITNLSSAPIHNLRLTNQLGSALQDSEAPIVWVDGFPGLDLELAPEIAVAQLESSQGAGTVQGNAVVFDLGLLDPGESCMAIVRLETQAHAFLHQLAIATGQTSSGSPVFSGALTSVDSVIHLSVQALPSGELEITWRLTEPELVLESADTLWPKASWQPVGEPTTVVDGQNTVRAPLAAASQFYRLVEKR